MNRNAVPPCSPGVDAQRPLLGNRCHATFNAPGPQRGPVTGQQRVPGIRRAGDGTALRFMILHGIRGHVSQGSALPLHGIGTPGLRDASPLDLGLSDAGTSTPGGRRWRGNRRSEWDVAERRWPVAWPCAAPCRRPTSRVRAKREPFEPATGVALADANRLSLPRPCPHQT